ncbi:energy transducer TonB [Undibacterium sp. Di26W]|uniref:energy transducer TonB n=1 Tax=Undibacterium sp. Di26W TaxID=3413035 RepID=UPI003BEFBDE9
MSRQFNFVFYIITKNDTSRSVFALTFSLVMHGLLVVFVLCKNAQDGNVDSIVKHADTSQILQIHFVASDTSQPDTRKAVSRPPTGNNLRHNNQAEKFREVQVQHKSPPALLQTADSLSYYYHVDELTTPPEVQNNVEPSATLTLVMDEVPEKPLQLRVLVNENGDVDDIEIEESKLSAEATRLVKEQFLKMKFAPGMIGDVAVKSQFVIEVSLSAAVHPLEFIEVSKKVIR